jgi:ribose transport system substrate-binding protein
MLSLHFRRTPCSDTVNGKVTDRIKENPVESRLFRTFNLAAVAAVAVLASTACGGSSSSTTSTSSGDTSSTSTAALDTAYKGVTGTPPTTATKPKAGVKLWVISCGESVPSCATPVKAAQEAAKAAGWTVSVCDGQLNPNQWGACVRQGISAKANVIIPIGIDCRDIKAPSEEAKAAGVTIVGGGGADCDASGGTKLWASERLQLDGYTIKQYWELNGKLNADWLIGKSNGKAQVLTVNFTDPLWGPWITEGFTKELATCSGCKIIKQLDLANNDFVSNTAVSKFSTALLQAPTADSIFVAVGGWMSGGLAQAVVSSGRVAKLQVTTGFGDAANYDFIRNNRGQNAVVGYASPWGAWGSVDTAIRVLNGEQPVVEGDGMQIVDKDHGMPAAGQDFQPSVDYVAAYKKAWGVS